MSSSSSMSSSWILMDLCDAMLCFDWSNDACKSKFTRDLTVRRIDCWVTVIRQKKKTESVRKIAPATVLSGQREPMSFPF